MGALSSGGLYEAGKDAVNFQSVFRSVNSGDTILYMAS
jgi:hypothetical protein